MPLPIPTGLDQHVYAPLLRLLRDTLVRPRELTERWRFSKDHLANLRRRSLGPPAIRLPTSSAEAKRPSGSLRYRLSDIVAAELMGTHGAVTLDRVSLVVASCEFLVESQRAAVVARLREALG